MAARPKRTPRKTTLAKRSTKHGGARWSARVTRTSNALDLERNVFTRGSPRQIARSLKRSAQRSTRRKSDPYRSAMSMLVFYINRAGKNLSPARRKVLERAKAALREEFGAAAARSRK
jgi:hypothetical protein